MSNNTIEYLIRLRDEFTAKMKTAAETGKSGGAAIAQGMAVAAMAGLRFKNEIGAGWDVLNGNYEALGTVLGALPGPLGEIGQIAGSALGAMIKETEEAAEGYRKLSAATGSSVEFLSGFKEAADDVRVSGEAVDAALTKFSKGLGGIEDATEGAIAGGKGVAGTLKDLGIAAGDSEGNLRPLADVLPEVADAFSRMADGPEKTAIAIQLFGKRGSELIPILNKGRDGIAEMAEEARKAGLTMSGETIDAVDKLKQAQDALGDSATAFGRKIGTAAIPALAAFIDKINFLIGVQGTYQESTNDVMGALIEFNQTGELSVGTLAKLRAGGNDTVGVLRGMAASTASESAGLGVLAGVTTTAAQALREAHPELFKLSEEADNAAASTTKLGEAQKDAATIQREYQTKVTDLTDAMSKREKGLSDIRDQEEKLTEAEKNGFISKEQLATAQGHLQDETKKVNDAFADAEIKIKSGATATEAMGKAAQGATEREKAFAEVTRDAAKAADELKEKTDNLTGGFGKMPEKMDAAAKAAMAWKIATGQMTVAQSEQELVAQGLTAQFVKNKISLKEMVDIGQQYRDGTISADEALKKSGAWKNAAFIGVAKQYREIETASGAASQSELMHADFIKLVTTVRKSQKASIDDVAYAQIYLNHANEADSKALKQAKSDMDNKLITEMQYQHVVINTGTAHDKLAKSAREVEDAYNKGTTTVSASTRIIDTWGQHLDDVGLKLDKTGNIVQSLPTQKGISVEATTKGVDETNDKIRTLQGLPPILVKSDTSGLVEPVVAAKKEAESPIVIPVTYEMKNQSGSPDDRDAMRGSKPGVSVSVPITVDTSGIDAQVKAAQSSLDKLAISKTISIAIDYSTVTAAFKKISDTKIDAKTLIIYADETDAFTAMDAVDNATLDSKTLEIYANYDTVMNGDNGALDVIQKYKIDSKTVDIFGINGGAMAAISAVRNALDALHDKTVFINAVQGTPPPNGSGSPDDRDNGGNRGALSVRDTQGRVNDGTGNKYGKLADTIIVRNDDDLDRLAMLVANRIAG
jgi:hypothetical protein